MMGLSEILLRTILAFCVLFILCRILGKKQLSQLTYFNYITGISISSITANVIFSNNTTFLTSIAVIIVCCALTILISLISLKKEEARKLLEGEPAIIIKQGKLLKQAMQSNRLNLHELSTLMREQNVFSISDIEYAILENNGKLTVLKKAQKQNATREDVQAPAATPMYLPTQIIVDGNVIQENLREFNLDEAWLVNQLKLNNVNNVKDVFYAELQTDGTVYLVKQ
jgi:uncharacterized membrane protein YcaP (DUF421 family)